MSSLSRRGFLGTSAIVAGGGTLADLDFLVSLGHAVASDATLDPQRVAAEPDLAALLRLLHATPADACVAVFLRKLQAGLSYQDFLAVLFLAALEHGDLHVIAQVYSAHRLGRDARPAERLLPLLWALNNTKRAFEGQREQNNLDKLEGGLPTAADASTVFEDAMLKFDPEQSERAIVALARSRGARHALSRLLEYGARNVSGTLGHHPIVIANGWRTLEALGWQHAEPILRYMARSFGHQRADESYAATQERVQRTAPRLPTGWANHEGCRPVTLELYALLRQGDASATSARVCTHLSTGQVKAGAIWDAIHLVAADLIFRYKTGGVAIGGVLVHAVTSTNALRFGFDRASDDRVRLLLLLQAIEGLASMFIKPAERDGLLRPMNLLELKDNAGARPKSAADIFALLPAKEANGVEKTPRDRAASDEACQLSFTFLSDPRNTESFAQTVRSFVCVKASRNPHDIKYPAAVFEDAALVSPEWQPHLLASSVHALHGSKSADTKALVQARQLI